MQKLYLLFVATIRKFALSMDAKMLSVYLKTWVNSSLISVIARHTVAIFLFALCFTCQASPIKQVVFFGDSATYDGKLNPFIKYIFSVPERFSNGPPWSIMLEKYLLKNKIHSMNYALPGGTARFQTSYLRTSPAFLLGEIEQYLLFSSKREREATLAIIWVGFNDYVLDYRDITAENYSYFAKKTVAGIFDGIQTLIAHGVKNFLVLNLADLSKSPFFLIRNKRYEISNAILQHNQMLNTNSQAILAIYPVNIHVFDVYNFFFKIKSKQNTYELINLTKACKAYGKICKNPENYFYWDYLHFTSKIHNALAVSVFAYLQKNWPDLVVSSSQ